MRAVVLLSGSGTNFQAVVDAVSAGRLTGVEIVAVGTDQPGAAGLHRADGLGAVTFVVDPKDYDARAEWDAALASAVAGFEPDVVVCSGFMRILGAAFLDRFGDRTVNTHPALLPSFPGAHGVRDALAYGVKVTGCTVHWVDAGVDTGPIIAQRAVEVREGESQYELHERIKVQERSALIEVLQGLADGAITFPSVGD
ncbi:phosphoribosylglycinamide formyltransferase [Pseudoglutamicibacter albus]|uniref:phosphoribosylglycinamide formyltransferase n=1 Tax=Pseudoglutamicibacter albus TaxID=98671 RepID=UPI000C76B742|nr:phosphoribosylglycinamide formyltransferase [Pseudoglutamicibacter albus]PKY80302.1 phosphoribosylglycinamide formyltransferase [Pseudoglutamicibacter albus]WIK85195.1 phosphoribosylglycinamide formyltransferase [Pseudoglutamicibacter albus]